jgi:serine/threonine protein kinase
VQTAFELRRLVRSQLNAIDPHGYPAALQVRRLNAAEGIRDSLGRILHYELLEEIGHGGMARVYKGLDSRTGSLVAIKKVATEGASLDEAAMRREIDIYSRLQEIVNPHILGVKQVFREEDTYALVTEYAEGGSLWELMGGDAIADESRTALDEATTKAIALALADGLSALHENEIVHRDIKPQNILRCDDVWKIADFGISKLISNPVSGYTFQGAHSLPWAPREQIEGVPAHPSADIYAFARVLAFLLTGLQKVNTAKLPPHWLALLGPCLDDDPVKRPDIDRLRAQIAALTV